MLNETYYYSVLFRIILYYSVLSRFIPYCSVFFCIIPKVHLILTKSSHPSQEKVTNAWMGWEVPYFLSSSKVTSAENGFSFTSMTKGESLEKRGKKCFLYLTEMVANFLKYEEIDTKKSDIQSQQLFSCQTFPIKVKFKRLGY